MAEPEPDAGDVYEAEETVCGFVVTGCQAMASSKMAIDYASRPGKKAISEVHFNRPLHSVYDGTSSKLRPDVSVLHRDGSAWLGEVVSPSQSIASQGAKIDGMINDLGRSGVKAEGRAMRSDEIFGKR